MWQGMWFWVETGGDIMDQPYISQGNQTLLNGWLFQEAVDLQRQMEELELKKEEFQKEREEFEQFKADVEQLREQLNTEQSELKVQRKELEKLQTEIQLEKGRLEASEKSSAMREEFEKQRQERSEQLFQMKWKMLEEELMKLAEDKKEFERMKRSANAYSGTFGTSDAVGAYRLDDLNCSVFFMGVHNELALKKRYRDLMKIFHPDNIAGDHDVVVQISKEFENMKEQFNALE